MSQNPLAPIQWPISTLELLSLQKQGTRLGFTLRPSDVRFRAYSGHDCSSKSESRDLSSSDSSRSIRTGRRS